MLKGYTLNQGQNSVGHGLLKNGETIAFTILKASGDKWVVCPFRWDCVQECWTMDRAQSKWIGENDKREAMARSLCWAESVAYCLEYEKYAAEKVSPAILTSAELKKGGLYLEWTKPNGDVRKERILIIDVYDTVERINESA